jgi:hypothetical protein
MQGFSEKVPLLFRNSLASFEEEMRDKRFVDAGFARFCAAFRPASLTFRYKTERFFV